MGVLLLPVQNVCEVVGLSQNNIWKLRNYYLLGWGVFRSRWLICNDEGPRVTKKVMGGRLSFIPWWIIAANTYTYDDT